MPNLTDHHSSELTKLMFIGNSGTGKTGALTSLVAAGYNLGILDMDNGLDSLKYFVARECPDKAANVKYITVRDKYMVSSQGTNIKGTPKAFANAMKHMEQWDDETKPEAWGPKTIFVLDTLDGLARTALDWAVAMNPVAANGRPMDGRAHYKIAQDQTEHFLANVTSAEFATNVIIISHITYSEEQGIPKGFPAAVGSALGPRIGAYFNTLLLAETTGSGETVKRRIKTVPTSLIDLKNPAPFKISSNLPLESGLATIFSELKG